MNAEHRTKMSDWWEDLPSPFHPTWELGDISERDLRQLKQNLDTDDNKSMVVEAGVHRAFLEFPRKRLFLNQPMDDPIKAAQYLISARKHVKEKFEGNRDAEIGYGIVINTFQMYIEKNESTESTLRDLILRKDDYPRHQSYVNVVRAYILSRLGPRKYGCALSLFDSALKDFPENCDWLLGKALLIGREAREHGYILGRSNQNVLDLLHNEKDCLERILRLKSDYYLARALYGKVLNDLGEREDAKTEISRALQEDPPSHSVAMVAARFYRRINDLKTAQSILQTLLKSYNTAETHFQLGLMKNVEARRFSITNKLEIQQKKLYQNERRKLWKQALQHFDDCLKLNSSHYACLSRRAEVNALLDNTKQAHGMFQHLLEYFYRESLHRSEMMCLDCALRVGLLKKNLFSPLEIIKYSYRYITLATEGDAIVITGVDNSAENVKSHLATLQKISSNEPQKDVSHLAALRLADASRHLKMFDNAVKIYENLLEKNEAASDEAEIIWGLAKCYLSQELEDKVIDMADHLKGVKQTTLQYPANELYADAYLSKAKSKLGNEKLFRTKNLSLYKSIEEHLRRAIRMGSLEASYLLLKFEATINKYFFSLEFGFPEILSHINLLCGQAYQGTIVHSQFNMKLDDGSEVGYDETSTKSLLMKKLHNILKYEYTNDEENRGTELYKGLEKLREKRLEFEIHLLGSKDGKWDENCRGSLADIVPTLRDLLDHCISFYMKTVLSYSKGQSMFPVKFDKDAGKVDVNAAKKKLDRWINENFREYPGKLPDEVIQTILKVQPIYDSKNNWLAALHFLNINLKHDTKLYAKETFELCVDKPEVTSTWKSEDIVRISCQEVEKIVFYFLSKKERL